MPTRYQEVKRAFRPCGAVTGIGSLSFTDPRQALDLVFTYCPELPYWPQLPQRTEMEGMIQQAGHGPSLTQESAAGFFAALDRIQGGQTTRFLKGQLAGPWTLALGVRDPEGRPAWVSGKVAHELLDNLKRQLVQQVCQIRARGKYPVVVLDEPGLVAYGTEDFKIPQERVIGVWQLLIAELQKEGALVGLHYCAQKNLELFFESGADLISFDASGDLTSLVARHKDRLAHFLKGGGCVAWGVVPTREFRFGKDAAKLADGLEEALCEMSGKGLNPKDAFDHSLVTPSCGLASLDEDTNIAIFKTCQEVSHILRRRFKE